MAEGNRESDTACFNPGCLLDFLLERMRLADDAALAKELKVAKPVIDKIRNRELSVSGSLLLWMHEATGVTVDELRHCMGDRRSTSRPQYRLNKDGQPSNPLHDTADPVAKL